ncbi:MULTISPECIES: HIT family protein [unclassified Enterococcus]|uniref:HIT family protein n=1 Tax=unclassified Enterococcus TaxID=2608891 RepID=UPI0013E9F5F5|nr:MULTISPECIES: HIT family protein [unclassified Enterococcus]
MQNYKDGCFYCEHNQTQQERMIEIMKLPVSTVYLNRDQTHFGRTIVALNWHVDELFELDHSDLQEFIQEVAEVAEEIKSITHCQKINYAIYGDTVSHLHFHLVPKTSKDSDWNEAFVNSPQNIRLIENEEEYRQFIQQMKERLERKHETIDD